ncbi:MAG: PHP domain-containing protein [Saccharofermentanales bacterium]
MGIEDLGILKEQLNAPSKVERLQAIYKIRKLIDKGLISRPVCEMDVNNHIHTIYSFSPYSPTKAVFRSWEAGLSTTGIMDHDSISGAEEFIEAGNIIGMPTTIGAEIRVSFAGTPLEGLRINNPDQNTVTYVALHGIPHNKIPAVKKFFIPVMLERAKRNRKMTNRINDILKDADINISYEKDVLPLSMIHENGSVTERHILFAVAKKMISRFGKGAPLVDFLQKNLGIEVKSKNLEYLLDEHNAMYEYDLLNVLKGNMVEQFYIPATKEALPVGEVSEFCAQNGIVLSYAYLGDITESVTGDKKAQHFEDAFLADVFKTLKKLDFKAVTYMPSRNTSEQLTRMRALCVKYNLFQISGEDINQPRQKFVCEVMRNSEFANLYDAAWALIGHELLATEDLDDGMFSAATIKKMPDMNERVNYFKDYAMKKYS